MMTLNYKLIALAGITTACHSGINKKIKTSLPNIIFIMSDDHAYQAISAYGGPLSELAPTPNIDKIAKMGMRFDRCLVTNSISGPSRACILTGKYSHKNGFYANETTPFDSSQQTFPKLLRQAGYQTAIIGKWHLDSQPTGFDHWEILRGQGQYYNPDFITSAGEKRDTGYVTDIITQKCIGWLKSIQDSGKPFMLMMHHKAPHRNWEPGPKDLSRYTETLFPEPTTLFDDYAGRGRAEHEQDMTIDKTMRLDEDLKMWSIPQKEVSLNRFTPQQRHLWDSIYDPVIKKYNQAGLSGNELVKWKYQRYMQDYLACIAAVDRSVGELLAYLEETGLIKNTVIIYTSDQGFYLGEHGWFDKRFMFEESYRTPLLIAWPGTIKAGSVNKDMVSNLDFAETFLEIAGIEIPSDMQGKSMLPLLRDEPSEPWRKVHYYHYYEYPGWHSVKRHYGISTSRYKLIHFYYDINEWELFDRYNDPNEMTNVYDDPEYSMIRKTLHHQLDSIRAVFGDSDSLAFTLL
jgi:arylsulfatase A-like enzyme